MALKTHINVDSQDQPLDTSGVDWVEFSEGNDKLIFTGGNSTIADGEDIPSEDELISAGIERTGSEIVVSTYLLQDQSANQLKSINLMGNQDGRYVMAFEFDAGTASEPVLEVWDDTNLDSANGTLLGGGTPSSSMVRGITTTSSSPGSNWATDGSATKMAGSNSGHFLYLNNQNGSLSSATNLYANLCIVIPSSQTSGFSASPIFAVKWLSN